jgi:release factor glutamine methyltransferase
MVNPDVLIPRPETEALVERGLSALAELDNPVAADIGTGSGCVAVALAVRLPGLTVYAVDNSPGALDVAQRNAASNGVSGRVVPVLGDLMDALSGRAEKGGLDLVVSNPPYVTADEMGSLQPEVGFEPAAALFGGPDGLDAVRRILADAPAWLRPGGTLLIEIGAGQYGAVRGLAEAQRGLAFEGFIKDFAGIERVLKARRG